MCWAPVLLERREKPAWLPRTEGTAGRQWVNQVVGRTRITEQMPSLGSVTPTSANGSSKQA